MVMKIESVESFPMRIRSREHLTGGTFSYTHYQTVLVKAEVDGVEGWGEAMTRQDPEATSLLVRYLSKEMVGMEFPDVRGAWERAWRGLRVRGHTRGTDVEALSGIEIALYDCVGKIEGKPLSKLLSPGAGEQVPVYAGSLFSSRGPLAQQVEAAKAAGMAGAKVKIGFGVQVDSRTLARVRRDWPEGMLVADANGAYGEEEAVRACEAFSGFGLAWFEEPVLSDDLGGYSRLRGKGVKIGAGESWFVDDFNQPIEEGLIDVVEPSVSRCGGIGVEAKVGIRARDRGMGFSPMTGMNSAISLAASLHIAASTGSVGVEFNPFGNPLQSDLASGLPAPRMGNVRVPSGPGLGLEVDVRFVKAHSE